PPLPGTAGFALSMAGLPVVRACVGVGPPYVPSGARPANVLTMSPVAGMNAQPVVLPIRLYPPEVTEPVSQSGAGAFGSVFPATMLFVSGTLQLMPPPP